MKKLLLFLVFATIAFGQACPGGFWGNGQCIAPCESPLVNPNVVISFGGFQCDQNVPCNIQGYIYCYPTYTAYDAVYRQYCGTITDYTDGGCEPGPPWLPFDRFAPKKRDSRDNPIPIFPHSSLKFMIDMRNPVEFRPIRRITVKNRFWWKKVRV